MGSQGAYHELPDGTLLPRVTSILSAISKDRLVAWAAREERLHVLRAASAMVAAAPQITGLQLVDALPANLGKAAHTQLVDEANEIGSAVHARIEWSLRRELGEVVGPRPELERIEAMHAYRVFKAWRATVHLRPIFIEQRVWSRKHGYAGTMDLFAEMELAGQMVHALIDWKSSKRVYGEAGLQNAAYCEALVEMGHAKHPIVGVILRLPKTGDQATAERKIHPPETHAERFATFLAAFRIWRWQEEQERAFKPVELPAPARPITPQGDEFAFA